MSQATNAAGIRITDKSCLIMDEVDGMSGGDRGGVGALNALIKKSQVRAVKRKWRIGRLKIILYQIPIICIANDRGAMKLKPLTNTTFNLSFKRYGSFKAYLFPVAHFMLDLMQLLCAHVSSV